MNFSEILDRPIAFQRPFVALGAGITGALMLSQAVYWARRGSNEQGWFFKTQVEWEEETGLGRAEQETARKRLVSLEVLEEDRKGIPAKLFYRVNFEKLEALLLAFCTRNQDCGNPAIKDAGNQQTGLRESDAPDCGNPANRPAGMSQSKLRKTTTETTTDTSSSGTAVAAPAGGKKVVRRAKKPAKKLAKKSPPPAGSNTTDGAIDDGEAALQEACRATWAAYSLAYEQRYKVKPVRNAPVNANVKALVKRLGYEEAPLVAAWYVDSVNEPFVMNNSHGVGVLVNQAEGYRTQWARAVSGAARDDQQAPVESYAQRAARQRVEEVTPLAARKMPGAPNPIERLSALMQSGLIKIGTEVAPIASEGDEHAPR